jgi:hypothetical protein
MNPAERETIRERLKEPFDSPRSYAANADLSPDIQAVRRLFGEEAVEKRVEKRLSFVLERTGFHAGSSEEQQAELVSALEFLGSTTEGVSRKRQDAAVFGKEAKEPFCSRKILEVATAIRPLERFYSDGEVKPVPKALLRKKLPEYPFFGRKGGSDIPRTRFCQTGPFRGFFREHAFPDGMPSEGKTLLLDPQWDWSHMTLAAVAFSVWQEKVLKNKTLERVPGTRVFRLEAQGNLEREKARS